MRLHRRKSVRSVQAAIIIGASLILSSALIPAPVEASLSAPNTVSLVEVNATISSSGGLEVVQKIHYPFPSRLNWSIFGRFTDLSIKRNQSETAKTRLERIDQSTRLSSVESASSWTISYQTINSLVRSDERDQLYLEIVREPGFVIERVIANINLPPDVTSDRLSGNAYVIGGVTETTEALVSPKSISYEATYLSPQAIFTVNAKWPTGIVTVSFFQQIRLALLNLEIIPWIVLGLLLPLLAIIVLSFLLIQNRRQAGSTTEVIDHRPSQLSPLIVGVLVDKKIYPKQIVAMLIDLCQRGYLIIANKKGEYYLSLRKQPDEQLESWERGILETLFQDDPQKHLNANQAKQLDSQKLYSPKVYRAYNAAYDAITQRKFFVENPHLTRVKFKLFALTLYFGALIGAIWTAFSNASPYLLLPLAGTLLMAYAILRLSPKLVRYRTEGLQARQQWQAFANFLALDQPLTIEAATRHAFEENLAYAVALSRISEWAQRFDQSPITLPQPDWFVSYEVDPAIEFAQKLEEFTESISKSLSRMRGPSVS